ncbi:MAG: class I SAM-dependent methyltransferase [Chloroflexi bacterium]|nr:class I SAM-dependent methyltransferase [Chloroflexota bacterium]
MHTPIARLMRQAVWARMDANFRAGMRVLELGCGTGEDALYLARRGAQVTATDASPRMLTVTAGKAAEAGVGGLVQTQVLDMNDLPPTPYSSGRVSELHAAKAQDPPLPPTPHSALFDGILSNFGALNCVRDLPRLMEHLAAWTKPGARVLLVVMGPFCPWEMVWHLLHGQPRLAFRRMARHATAGGALRGVSLTYPSPGHLVRLCAPEFAHRRTAGLGVLLPPPYVRVVDDRWLAAADRIEQRIADRFPFNRCGDHYILELERKGVGALRVGAF